MDTRSMGQFIAALRKSRGMTQQEVADRLNVTNKTVSKWERGEGYPEITMIPALAELFEVTTDEILKGARIQKEEGVSEKTPAKVEKQRKWLLSSAITRFKNNTYIALGLIFVGLVSVFTIAYATYRPVVGFGIMLIFLSAGVLLELIVFNNTSTALKGNELLGEDDSIALPYLGTMYRLVFSVFASCVAVIVLAMPFILVRDQFFVNSVINFGDYIRLLPILMVVYAIICSVSYVLVKQLAKGNPAFAHKPLSEEQRKAVRRLNKTSAVVLALILGITIAGHIGIVQVIATTKHQVTFESQEEFDQFIANYDKYEADKLDAERKGYMMIYNDRTDFEHVIVIDENENEEIFYLDSTYEDIATISYEKRSVLNYDDYSRIYSAQNAANVFFSFLYFLVIALFGIVYLIRRKRITQ